MAQLLIRDLDSDTLQRLKVRANRHGRSLQKEAKLIVEEAAQQDYTGAWDAIEHFHQRMLRSGRKFSDSTELIREDRE